MEKKTKLDYIDIVKGIGIILVVYAHVFWNIRSLWIYSFHMPLFFIIAGMLIRYKNDEKIKIKHMIIKYIKWYLIFSILAVISIIVKSCLIERILDFNLIKESIKKTITFEGYSALWFLPTFLISKITFISLYREKIGNIILFAISLIGVFISNNMPEFYIVSRICIAISFIWIGYYLENVLNNKKRWFESILLIISLIISLKFFIYNWNIDLRLAIIGNPFFYYLLAISGSVAVILFSKIIIKKSRILQYAGKNSIIILGTHLTLYIVGIGQCVMKYINGNNIFKITCGLITIIIVQYLVIEIFNKITYCFKSRNKQKKLKNNDDHKIESLIY